MILYFTGTGNSEYAAKRISAGTNQPSLNLFQKIRDKDYSALWSDEPWVIVCPTYAWRIPRIVEQWVRRTPLRGNRSIYFVMTCGDDTGNAGRYLSALCKDTGLNYEGRFEIVMPENYVAMFDTPGREEAIRIIKKSEGRIDKAIEYINSKVPFPKVSVTIGGILNSSVVNTAFYPVCVHAGQFRADNRCISCGKCERVCPLGNITMRDGRPKWGDNCTHCMACICRCPKEAIEYGRHSINRPKYICPL